jgi:hypothetical protein
VDGRSVITYSRWRAKGKKIACHQSPPPFFYHSVEAMSETSRPLQNQIKASFLNRHLQRAFLIAAYTN